MTRITLRIIAVGALALVAAGGAALSAQDKYTVKAANGLAFAEFRGYENWQVIAVSHAGDLLAVIVGNPAMIAAYKAGAHTDGKGFPDGAKMAKIHWKTKVSKDPGDAIVPDTLHAVAFMAKDRKRFPDANGWGFQQFLRDAATDTFKPGADDAKCGVACHTAAKDRDFVFTSFQQR